MTRLRGHLFDDLAAGFVAGQPGDGLEPGPRRVDQLLAFGFAVGERLLAAAEILLAAAKLALAPLEGFGALVDAFLARRELALERGEFAMLVAHLALGLRAHLDQQIFGL